jgi:TPP-dependent pyruvate/acetoin dehydrogenase alpha subunit
VRSPSRHLPAQRGFGRPRELGPEHQAVVTVYVVNGQQPPAAGGAALAEDLNRGDVCSSAALDGASMHRPQHQPR